MYAIRSYYDKVPTPKTVIVSDARHETVQHIIAELGLPVVLKIPDGSFSRGVIRVESEQELAQELKHLRHSSSLVLARITSYNVCYTKLLRFRTANFCR